MKLTAYRLLAFLLLIALSVGFGFAFDAVATAVEKHNAPRVESLAVEVSAQAEQNGIPEPVIWAMLCEASGFQSNAANGDRVGLMQLTHAQLNEARTLLLGLDAADAGMLYDPSTNLSAGCAYLSHLYLRYGTWELVFAAYFAGSDTMDAWLADPKLSDDSGVLKAFPDSDINELVHRILRTAELYEELYYNA